MNRELAKWLGTFDWTLWATFTFPYTASAASAERSMRRFVTYLRKSGPVGYIAVVENKDGAHIHALLSGISADQARSVEGLWHRSHGLSRVRPYNQGGSATGYITKHIHHESTSWWIDV